MTERYSPEMRALQDRFDTRRMADAFARKIFRTELNDDDRAFIARARFFFLATVDAAGQPQCSYKGGPQGFVKVAGPAELVFPLYDGNGMYMSAGNIAATGRVGLLFVDFEVQRRKRMNGVADIVEGHPAMAGVKAAQLAVRVRLTEIFPNCARNVHRMDFRELSKFTPDAPEKDVGYPPWTDEVADVLPAHLAAGRVSD